MAADSFGVKNEPQFAGTGAPADAADLTAAAAYAAKVGNRMVGTSSQRTALTGTPGTAGSDRWVGLLFGETDTLSEWLYTSSGWALVEQFDSGWQAVSFGSGYSSYTGGGYPTVAVRKLTTAGRTELRLRGVPQKTGGPVANDVAFTLPVGYRPLDTRQITAFLGASTTIGLIVNTDGTVVVPVTNTSQTISIVESPISL